VYNRGNLSDLAVEGRWREHHYLYRPNILLKFSNPVNNGVFIGLSQSWTNETVPHTWSSEPILVGVLRGNVWYNPADSRMYMWGGWPYNTSYSSGLWFSTPWSNGTVEWEMAPLSAANGLGEGATAPFDGAFVASDRAFYNLGGVFSPNSSGYFPGPGGIYTAVQGLIEYDFASGIWRNDSTTDATQSGYSIQANAARAPNFGKAGFLIFVGGDIPNNQTYAFDQSTQLASMSVITLYDLESKTWYHQNATGDIPPERIEFCSVGAVSLENSFEM
jgi:hypothetical protein